MLVVDAANVIGSRPTGWWRDRVVHAIGEGDDTIVAVAESHAGVVAVTADRELIERLRAVGADVVGPRWLLDQLME